MILVSLCIFPVSNLFLFPNSGDFLELCVMPKDEDILQLVSFSILFSKWGSLHSFKTKKAPFWKCVFFSQFLKPKLLTVCPDPRPFQSCSSLRSSCWDSYHEMQAAPVSHQSFLSRPPNQARAAFLSSNCCWHYCWNSLIGFVEQALSKIHRQS